MGLEFHNFKEGYVRYIESHLTNDLVVLSDRGHILKSFSYNYKLNRWLKLFIKSGSVLIGKSSYCEYIEYNIISHTNKKFKDGIKYLKLMQKL